MQDGNVENIKKGKTSQKPIKKERVKLDSKDDSVPVSTKPVNFKCWAKCNFLITGVRKLGQEPPSPQPGLIISKIQSQLFAHLGKFQSVFYVCTHAHACGVSMCVANINKCYVVLRHTCGWKTVMQVLQQSSPHQIVVPYHESALSGA